MLMKKEAMDAAVSALGSIGCEVMCVTPDDNGWHMRAVDNAHVAMVCVDLPAACFEGYEIWDRFAVDLDRVSAFASAVKTDMQVGMGDGHLSLAGGGLRRRVPLLPCEDDPRVPDVPADASVLLTPESSAVMLKGLRLASAEDEADIRSADGRLTVAMGDVTFEPEAAAVGTARVRVPLDYLTGMLKAADGVTELSFGTDVPLTVRSGYAVWLLAPRVHEEDD